jgi:hypothetical protein
MADIDTIRLESFPPIANELINQLTKPSEIEDKCNFPRKNCICYLNLAIIKIRMKSRNWNIVLTVVALFSLIFASCSNKYSYSDDLKSIQIPLQDMLPQTMVRAIIKHSDEVTIPIALTNKQGEKLEGADFIIDYGDSSVFLKSDAKGVIAITLHPAILNKNPLIKISHHTLSAQEIEYSIGGKTLKIVDGKSVYSEVFEYDNLPFIEENNFRMYYIIHPDSAKASFTDYYNMFSSIKRMLKKDDIQLLYPFLVSNREVVVIGAPKEMSLMSINQNSWMEKSWFFIHETVESELILRKKVSDKNPNIRYIGDGLAEYISLKILQSYNPGWANEMLDSRIKNANKLTTDEVQVQTWSYKDNALTELYASSLAFWLKMDKEYGEQAVLDFIHSFLALNDFDSTTVSSLMLKHFKKTKQYSLQKKEILALLTSSKK